MTELEKILIENLKEISNDFLSVSYNNIHIKDMTRSELELLCVLLSHQSMLEGQKNDRV